MIQLFDKIRAAVLSGFFKTDPARLSQAQALPNPQGQQRQARRLFFLLLALFLAPSLSAIYVYQHPQILSHSTINKGKLHENPLLIKELSDKSHWHLVLWSSELTSLESVEPVLQTLAAVRLALGRYYYLLDLVYLSHSETALKFPLQDYELRQDMLSLSSQALLTASFQKPAVFIVDPNGFLILSYPITVAAKDIFDDLKILVSHDQQKPISVFNPGLRKAHE